ncbi:hypothetical protein BDV97DRAFT_93575 [Delphinella strobiligena]|nr:hypothetical protein BDV97DRAFT_93575 [Delphinella strobiligena]
MAIAPDGGHHVPAWKRLGLTLKHAKDVAEPSPQSQSHSKRSSDHHDHDHDQNIKKRKLSDEAHPSSPAPKKLPADALATPSKNKSLSSIKKSPTKTSDRRKSVTFSNDTKTEDGDTAQNAFRDWVAEQNEIQAQEELVAKRLAASNPPVDNSHALKISEKDQSEKRAKVTKFSEEPEQPKDSKKADSEKKQKGDKKKSKDVENKGIEKPKDAEQKKAKVKTPKTGDKPLPEYVKYLDTYHNDRPNWKFNKSKQNDVLKNIWNVYRISPDHNEALIEYINGLQGAGARQRLKDSARGNITAIVSFIREEIPEVSDDPMDTIEARRAAFKAAEERELAKLSALGIDLGKTDQQRVDLLKQKQQEDERAVRLLAALQGALDEMDGDEATARESAQVSQPETARSRKKKRKARTVASESEGSSSDDSDSDGETATHAAPKKKQKTMINTKADVDSSSDDASDTSSDTSSDDSSDSDSDDDSDDDASSSDASSSDSE